MKPNMHHVMLSAGLLSEPDEDDPLLHVDAAIAMFGYRVRS